jgi:hypothetical protein
MELRPPGSTAVRRFRFTARCNCVAAILLLVLLAGCGYLSERYTGDDFFDDEPGVHREGVGGGI